MYIFIYVQSFGMNNNSDNVDSWAQFPASFEEEHFFSLPIRSYHAIQMQRRKRLFVRKNIAILSLLLCNKLCVLRPPSDLHSVKFAAYSRIDNIHNTATIRLYV